MTKDWKITSFKPDRPGIFQNNNSLQFAVDTNGCRDCGIILYDEKGEPQKYPFSLDEQNGTLAGLEISGSNLSQVVYNYYQKSEVFTDPYAQKIKGLEIWGGAQGTLRETRGCICEHEFDWQGDHPLRTPYEDSIFYGINVRSFTMHKSSGVKKNGTYEGVVEKIPYLKSLGITAVELMPCYEYEECMFPKVQIPEYTIKKEETPESTELPQTSPMRLNCWGFQQGFYFAPKASYSAAKDPVVSFKTMVRELHKNGIEVLMHFYFPQESRQLYILEVLKYWVKEYHVDGFRLSGFELPYRLLIEEPVLKQTKLRLQYLPEKEKELLKGTCCKNFAIDNQGFRTDMRKFLKGDEGLINQVMQHQRYNPREFGSINYLTDYDGFSLYDCVSYERKHNEENGEENRDGTEKNYSWNCGTEGESRKKMILQLRQKQMKNALTFLLLGQGTPFIFGGDELANTRYGNNNPYCQDNETGWIKWKENKFSKEILDYTKFLITLRKGNRILHMPEEFKIMDSISCGYPDLSYHGVEAWRPDLGYMSRMIGITLCGQYAEDGKGASFYIGYNMHWQPHQMALPKLPKGMVWEKISDTSWSQGISASAEENKVGEDLRITVEGRSSVIYQTRPAEKKELPAKGSRKKNKGIDSNL